MVNISYVVHSDTNENNVLCEFTGRGAKQQAIKYAKSWKADDIWVDRTVVDWNTNEEDTDTVWCAWEDDYEDDRSELPWDYSKHFE